MIYRHAVTASQAGNDAGHLPREISHWGMCFLDHDGSIEGTVTGARRYSIYSGWGDGDPLRINISRKKKTYSQAEETF